jgi:hypothetical protein
MPRFSIVIPCYNGAAHLRAAIESCLAQTAADLEVIVVDDGSTDRSGAIASDAAAVDTRVRTIAQANAGVGAARNAGLAAAVGEFVNFLDADDLLDPEKLERQGAVLADDDRIGIVLCDGVVIDEDGRPTGRALVNPRRFEGPALLFDVLFSGGQFPPLVPLLRRSLANSAGGFTTDRALAGWADTAFWMKVALLCPAYHFLPDCLCRYRERRASMSSDGRAMEAAAEGIYADLLRTHPREAALALRRQQARLEDLEYAAARLDATIVQLDAGIRAVQQDREAAIRDLQLHYEAALETERGYHEATRADARARHEALLVQHGAELAQVRAEAARAIRGIEASNLRLQVRHAVAECRNANRSLALWGAGAGGRQALAIIATLGGTIDVCVDSDPAKSGTYLANGVLVMTPSEFARSTYRDAFVLVSSTRADEIERQLDAMSRMRDADYLTLDSDLAAILVNQQR